MLSSQRHSRQSQRQLSRASQRCPHLRQKSEQVLGMLDTLFPRVSTKAGRQAYLDLVAALAVRFRNQMECH